MVPMRGLAIKRKTMGMSQEDLAPIMGVSAITVSRWETGRQSPDTSTLLKLSQFFSCTIDDLLNPTMPRQPGAESAAAEPVVAEG